MTEHTVAVVHTIEQIGWVTVEADSAAEARDAVIRSFRQPETWHDYRDFYRMPKATELEVDHG